MGPLLDFLRLRRGVRGIPIVGYVLAFICGFGVGGLLGTSGMNAETLPAAGLGVVGGLLGILLIWVTSDARTNRRSSAEARLDYRDLVGHRGRLSMPLQSHVLGTVSLIYRGNEREFPATAESDIPAGSQVVVSDVDEAASTLTVTLASHAAD